MNRFVSIAFLTLALPGLVFAQESGGDVIEEILVTAQKREQTLEEIPQSIQLLDADMIEEYSLRDVSEVMSFIPGASEGLGISQGSRRYQIRGVYPAAGNNTVGFYIGDAPAEGFSGTAPLGRLYDMQQVEILRGPQSTLYGNGAMGGVVRYLPNQPDLNEFDLGLRAGYSTGSGADDGNYVDVFAQSCRSSRDKLGIRVVGSVEDLGGYAEDVAGNENINGGDLKRLPNQRTGAAKRSVRP